MVCYSRSAVYAYLPNFVSIGLFCRPLLAKTPDFWRFLECRPLLAKKPQFLPFLDFGI